MMTAASTFDLVAVAPPHADRRALSQAWYDALHLAERANAVSGGTVPRAAAPPCPHRAASAANAPRAIAGGTNGSARHSPAGVRPRPPEPGPIVAPRDRRAPPGILARRIVARLRAEPSAAGFSLSTPRGRVRVCVRKSGGTIRLFALCRPALLAEVEAALAQARFALAGNGVRVGW